MQKYCRTKGTQKTFFSKIHVFLTKFTKNVPDATQYYYMGPHPQTTFIWFKLRIFGILRFQKVCADKQHRKKFWIFEKAWIFQKKILVPFGCTYLFWDNMTYIIQKFINWRIFFIRCSFFNNTYFRSYRFQKFSEKK